MNRKRISTVPYVIWMALFVVIPLLLIVVYAFTTKDGGFSLENFSELGSYTAVFIRSIVLALTATVICLVIGYPVSYILARESASFQRISNMLIMLPMWINFLLRTYAWMSILENTGMINRFLGKIGVLALLGVDHIQLINTNGAVILGMVYNYLPFMILPIFSVIQRLDRSLIEAAQDLGATGFQVFTKVIFPLSLPGVLSGITMVFVPSISTFAISKLLGGGTSLLLGDLIEMQFLGGAKNPYLGSAISLIMMIMVMVCMLIMNRFGEGEEEAVML
ncbi:MAG: ABC transporter permease [Clostridia bacterium]|nr:ABC transporter permease [Clostridia bacterium]